MSVLVTALVIWCIRTSWKSTESEDVWRKSLTAFRRIRGNLFKSVKDFKPFRTRSVPRQVLYDNHIPLTDRGLSV